MKFPPFAYRAPSSAAEAVEILAAEPEAKILAGGQSLLPLLALRIAQPSVLVDISGVAELAFVDGDGGVLRIGGSTTLATLETSPVVVEKAPLLAKAIRYVAHRPIRNRATIGGSLAHADPAAELPAVAVALDATLVVRGPSGERRIAADDFFTGAFTTALADDEILAAVELPAATADWAFLEIARRSGDFALAMAAVGIEHDGDTCRNARVVVQGVAGRPVRATAAEDVLAGAPISQDVAARAGEAATAELRPPADIHASSDYRKRVAATLVRRAVLEAGRREQ